MRKRSSLFLVLLLLAGLVSFFQINPVYATDSSYTVKRGDNLTSIAANYGISVSELASANQISNPNVIFSGQVLKIPHKNQTPTTPTQTPPVASSGESAYIVQRGDTLSVIAENMPFPSKNWLTLTIYP